MAGAPLTVRALGRAAGVDHSDLERCTTSSPGPRFSLARRPGARIPCKERPARPSTWQTEERHATAQLLQ